jgi:phosphoribosylamine--glycine ligase
MTTRVVVVGGGAREHAIAWACQRGREDVEVICAPGNGGSALIAENVAVDVTDAGAVARLAKERGADLVVIGPDSAAAAGVADACNALGVAVFGPTAAAARIESSKAFAKSLMDDAGIPTARWVGGDAEQRRALLGFIGELDGQCVVKADGLALGKGVVVCEGVEDAERALTACFDEQRFGAAGARVVVEERLKGREVSVLALSDGERLRVLSPARDYKRAFDGDSGPNTGGMGACAPTPDADAASLAGDATTLVLQPCIDALRERGTPFVGCLYAGLMLTDTGIRVLEFNARFGDPEAQVVLPVLDKPLLDMLRASARGELNAGVSPPHGSAVGVVAASAGYPGDVQTGHRIHGLDTLDDGVLCFHAGTRRESDGAVRTNGGRVLTVVGRGDGLDTARMLAYDNLERIHFEGMRFRTDIAQRAVVAA